MRALEIQRESLDPMAPELALTLHTLGLVHHASGNLSEAEACFQEALEIRDRPDASPSDLAETIDAFGGFLRETGRTEEAESLAARIADPSSDISQSDSH